MKPDDFWGMTARELWWLLEAKRPQQGYAGGMTEEQVAELYEANYGSMDEWSDDDES